MTGGEALNPDVSEKWKKQTGLEVHEGYGQSETVSAAHLPLRPQPGVGTRPHSLLPFRLPSL